MTDQTRDRRRYGVIETQFRQLGKLAMYNLTINHQLWAGVEWSPSRKAWYVQGRQRPLPRPLRRHPR
jgi:hypothetical protein